MAIKRLFEKFAQRLRGDGLVSACAAAATWLANRTKALVGCGDQIQRRRLQLSALLNDRFGATVRYGPFRGLQLGNSTWWGNTDRAGMLLGVYEQEVLSTLERISAERRRSFIELGAADGYYGVGVLVNNLFERSYCFELSEKGQRTIAINAALNDVESRVQVFGTATSDFHTLLPPIVVDNCVLLVDVEGAEFDILITETFRRFAKSIIIVEMHDHFFPDAQRRVSRLRKDCEALFDIEELTTTGRDMSKFPELKEFSDTDRWLICSEGRRAMPHWFVMTPRERA